MTKKRYGADGAKEYREANRRIQKAVEKAKDNWIGAQCKEIETCLNKKNSMKAYQLVKDLTSEKQGRSSTIQDKSGKCLAEEQEGDQRCSCVISIFLYACESWTLTAELEKRMQAFGMRCYKRLWNILYKDHVTNEEVRRKIQAAIGEYQGLKLTVASTNIPAEKPICHLFKKQVAKSCYLENL